MSQYVIALGVRREAKCAGLHYGVPPDAQHLSANEVEIRRRVVWAAFGELSTYRLAYNQLSTRLYVCTKVEPYHSMNNNYTSLRVS